MVMRRLLNIRRWLCELHTEDWNENKPLDSKRLESNNVLVIFIERTRKLSRFYLLHKICS